MSTDTLTDFTELRRLTERFDITESFFEMFVHQNPALVWMKDYTDGEGRMAFVSDNVEGAFGYKADDWVGKTDSELLPEHVASQLRRQDKLVIETGQPTFTEESSPYGVEEKWRVTRVIKFPVFNSAGDVIGVGGMAWPKYDRTTQ